MLHVVAFAFFSVTLMMMAAGIAFMLYAARDRIGAALQTGTADASLVASGPSRIRIVRTTRDRRIMPLLRAAA